jgi:hypothetical protein
VTSSGLGDVLVDRRIKKPSETNGEDIDAFGGSWLAVSPAGATVAGWNS